MLYDNKRIMEISLKESWLIFDKEGIDFSRTKLEQFAFLQVQPVRENGIFLFILQPEIHTLVCSLSDRLGLLYEPQSTIVEHDYPPTQFIELALLICSQTTFGLYVDAYTITIGNAKAALDGGSNSSSTCHPELYCCTYFTPGQIQFILYPAVCFMQEGFTVRAECYNTGANPSSPFNS